MESQDPERGTRHEYQRLELGATLPVRQPARRVGSRQQQSAASSGTNTGTSANTAATAAATAADPLMNLSGTSDPLLSALDATDNSSGSDPLLSVGQMSMELATYNATGAVNSPASGTVNVTG